jgi:superoxide dismutase, Fe-Mn family
MDFTVPALPYEKDALEPVMSKETLEFHYEKHHKGYMTKLKAALEGKPEASKSLEEIVKTSEGGVFNNAAQVWNHTFWWNSIKPGGGGAPPSGPVGDLVQKYGGWDKLRADIIDKAGAQFGSGWGWLVLSGGALKVVTTSNAETPLTTSDKPLCCVDVWEHAYYIDHRNARPAFLEAFCDKLLNWDFVAKNL